METQFEDVEVIKSKLSGCRSSFTSEPLQKQYCQDWLSIRYDLVKLNCSHSARNVELGRLHLQAIPLKAKLAYISEKKIYAITIDVRPESFSFEQCLSIRLFGSNGKNWFYATKFARKVVDLSKAINFVHKWTDHCAAMKEPFSRRDCVEIFNRLSIKYLLFSGKAPRSKTTIEFFQSYLSINDNKREVLCG